MGWNPYWNNVEFCRIAWKGWKVMNDWNVRNVWNDWNVWNVWKDWNVSGVTGVTGVPLEGLVAGMPGMSCKTHGWISRRSPCLLCVEFLFWIEGSLPSSSSTRRALWLLHVELDSGWRILWMYCV